MVTVLLVLAVGTVVGVVLGARRARRRRGPALDVWACDYEPGQPSRLADPRTGVVDRGWL